MILKLSTALLASLLLLQAAPARAEDGPADFIADAKLLMRVVACQGDAPLPEGMDAKAVEEHCKTLAPRIESYRAKYVKGAQEFLGKIIPADVPKTVVYPFGGADLLTALTTYPNATEYTTISLEHSGDVRRVRTYEKKKFKGSLDAIHEMLTKLLEVEDFSRSLELSNVQQKELPAELAFFMTALAVHGDEPVSLKYFRIEPDGSTHYYSQEEINASEKKKAKRLKKSWADPSFGEAFSNVELTFKKIGAADATAKVHRHIAGNLHDDVFGKDLTLRNHLEKKGHVAAVVKAASYLLWQPGFSKIREYLLRNADFTVSESSGIPPRFAEKAGMIQETYGDFKEAYLPDASKEISKEMEKFWKAQPHRELPFRFGYPDSQGKPHMLITRRAPAEAPKK